MNVFDWPCNQTFCISLHIDGPIFNYALNGLCDIRGQAPNGKIGVLVELCLGD